MDVTLAELDRTAEGLISFIRECQSERGAFWSQEWTNGAAAHERDYGAVFPTAFGARALQLSGSALCREPLQRARSFIAEARGPELFWKHWEYRDPRWNLIPFDVDDTATALQVTGTSPVALAYLFNECERITGVEGLVRTWMIEPEDLSWQQFFQHTEAKPDDVDLCVLANLLTVLEPTSFLAPNFAALNLITSLEAPIDKWYLDWPIRAYCFATAAAAHPGSFRALRAALPVLMERSRRTAPPRSLTDCAAELSALCKVGALGAYTPPQVWSEKLEELVHHSSNLATAQREIAYYGGPSRAAHWHCPATAACLAVEAIADARRALGREIQRDSFFTTESP